MDWDPSLFLGYEKERRSHFFQKPPVQHSVHGWKREFIHCTAAFLCPVYRLELSRGQEKIANKKKKTRERF